MFYQILKGRFLVIKWCIKIASRVAEGFKT